jgi:hypothetical protein
MDEYGRRCYVEITWWGMKWAHHCQNAGHPFFHQSEALLVDGTDQVSFGDPTFS